jgi:hypothetical protein
MLSALVRLPTVSRLSARGSTLTETPLPVVTPRRDLPAQAAPRTLRLLERAPLRRAAEPAQMPTRMPPSRGERLAHWVGRLLAG